MIAAVAFSNATALPFVFLTTIRQQLSYLFEESGAASKLRKTPENDPVVYLSMYLLVYPIVQWVGGERLLRPSSRISAPDPDPGIRSEVRESAANLLGAVEGELDVLQPGGPTRSSSIGSEIELHSSHLMLNDVALLELRRKERIWNFLSILRARVLAYVKPFLIPPVIGTLLGMLMGVFPPTYWLFCGGTFPQRLDSTQTCPASGGAVLGWLTIALKTLGDAAGFHLRSSCCQSYCCYRCYVVPHNRYGVSNSGPIVAVPVNLILLGNSLCHGPNWSAL